MYTENLIIFEFCAIVAFIFCLYQVFKCNKKIKAENEKRYKEVKENLENFPNYKVKYTYNMPEVIKEPKQVDIDDLSLAGISPINENINPLF